MTNDTPQRVARGYKRHGARYKARRRAVDLLFEGEARDTDPVELAQERNRLATDPENQVAPVGDYTLTIVDGVAVQLDVLDEVIERYLTEDWELYRIPAVDRAILRLSVWELLFNPEVPPATAVVEGTELASQYSGPKAASYINAMLDRVRAERDDIVLALAVVVPGADDAAVADDAVDTEAHVSDSPEAEPADELAPAETHDSADITAVDTDSADEPAGDTDQADSQLLETVVADESAPADTQVTDGADDSAADSVGEDLPQS